MCPHKDCLSRKANTTKNKVSQLVSGGLRHPCRGTCIMLWSWLQLIIFTFCIVLQPEGAFDFVQIFTSLVCARTGLCVHEFRVSFIQVMCLFSMTWIVPRFIFLYLPYVYSHYYYYNYYTQQMYIIHKLLVSKSVFGWLFPQFL